MALLAFPRFGSRRPKVNADPFDILGDLVPWQEAVDATAAKLSSLGLRNRIINGDFRINQRGYVSATALGLGVYGFDRWKSTTAATSLTFVAAPNGQAVTISAGGSIGQVLERANMPAGRYVIGHSGTAQVRAYNVGAAAPAYAAGPVVVDLDGTADVIVELFANGGATKTASLVQVEQIAAAGIAADASPFERRPRALELFLCQGYYWRVAPKVNAQAIGTTNAQGVGTFPATMRAAPTVTVAKADLANWRVESTGGARIAPTDISCSADTVGYVLTATATVVTGQATQIQSTNLPTANVAFDAELP